MLKTKFYLKRFGITDDPTCLCLQEDQTVKDWICKCVKLKQQTEKLITDTEQQANGRWHKTCYKIYEAIYLNVDFNKMPSWYVWIL